ncbi:hypothetical protein KF840_02205 [bacterium]|nr:hypothetical protein [bacterium]
MAVDLALVREAFDLSGEKHFGLARRLYPLVFGGRWTDAVLAFAYLKCLDDLVDEDPDGERALRTLARQRVAIAAAYDGDGAESAGALPGRFGLPVFIRDRARGARLRGALETILDSMELDTRRRGIQLSAAELDAYVVELGGAVLALFAELAAPGATLPPAAVREGSRAYLYADALIDLSHDLALGVVNVPREDGDWRTWAGAGAEGVRHAWIARRVPQVLAHFTRSRAELRRIRPWTLRVFLGLYLAAKRRKLLRHLARRRQAAGSADTDPSQSSTATRTGRPESPS